MVDESYVSLLEKRIEDYETMFFMSSENSEKSSNFTVMQADTLFAQTKDLIKKCERATEVRNHQVFRKVWYQWRYRRIGKWNRTFYLKRLQVSFSEWYASEFTKYMKSGLMDYSRTIWFKAYKIDPFKNNLTELNKMAFSVTKTNKNIVFVKQDDMIMLVEATKYADSWLNFVKDRWNNRLPVSLKNIEEKTRKNK